MTKSFRKYEETKIKSGSLFYTKCNLKSWKNKVVKPFIIHLWALMQDNISTRKETKYVTKKNHLGWNNIQKIRDLMLPTFSSISSISVAVSRIELASIWISEREGSQLLLSSYVNLFTVLRKIAPASQQSPVLFSHLLLVVPV